MASVIHDAVSWINDTFGTSLEVSVNAGTPEYFLALGIGLAFFLFVGLFLAGTLGNRPRLSILAGAGVASVGLGIIVQHYTDLVDWLVLGFRFTEVGPTIFAVGLACFTAVIAWNMLRTKGDKLVL